MIKTKEENTLKNNRFFNFKSLLIKNTVILVIASLLIKFLSLFNRVYLTRLLGNDGISLYVLCLPTIMLLLSLGGFSLNVTITKITSENIVKKQYSQKDILKISIKIGLIFSILICFIFSLFIYFIANNLLKQPDSFYPLLLSITIVPFVALNNCYRGYFNGLDKVILTAKTNLIEQIARLLFSIVLLYIFKDFPIFVTVGITIMAMLFGELFSLLYNVIKVNKLLAFDNLMYPTQSTKEKEKRLQKEIFSMSIAQTLSHLIANISFFLEPIVYTYALSKLLISNKEIMYKYSEVNAYALPLLTMFFFVSNAISTVIIPSVTKSIGTNKVNPLVKKALRLSLIPGIYLGIILYYFASDYMELLYKTKIGANFVREFSFIFIFFYLQPVLISVLQAHSKQKNLLFISTFDSVFRLVCIFLLSLIKTITYKSLIYSVIITNILATLILLIYVIKLLSLKIDFKNIFKFIFLFFFLYFTIFLLNLTNLNYILISLCGFLIYLIIIVLLKIK